MSRRQLPSRSSRGQKPVINQQQQKANNAFYEAIFGIAALNDSQEQEESKKEQIRQQRKQRIVQNLVNYSYARAHHYFFDLNNFPRLEGHPSYAADFDNAFGWTFSQEQKMHKESKFSEIFNRFYFGLPLTNKREREEDHSKNSCHAVLFEGQDKKYNLQRMIYTCKKVLKRLEHLVETGHIKKFRNIVKKQAQLEKLSSEELSLDTKREILQRVIKALIQKKQINREAHQYQDRLHFYFSQNQLFHNLVSNLDQKISLSLIPLTIYSNQVQYLTTIKECPENLSSTLKNLLKYHLSDDLALSNEVIERIVLNNKAVLLSERGDKLTVNLPCKIFAFGNQNHLKILNEIISGKICKVHGDLGFYTAKFAWSKLFRMDIIQNKSAQKIPYPQYRAKMQSFISHLKEQLTQQVQASPSKQTFDEKLNSEQLESTNQQEVDLLKKTNPIQISEKQLLIIVIYSYLDKSLSKLYSTLEKNPQYIKLFSSQHFTKHYFQILEIVNEPYFGVFNSTLKLLVQSITHSGSFFNIGSKLQFDYNTQNRVGVIWKKSIAKQDEWQSFEEQQNLQEEEQQNQGNIPKKKTKEESS